MRKIRFWLALWVGKIINNTLRKLGKKGTTFPGLIAQKIDPYIIRHLSALFEDGAVIITGTNGKTTTNNLFASILQSAGRKVAFNREGANMLTGITGALLQNTTFIGKPKASLLLLEVDEATVPRLCAQITPRLALITNFFRDQLDRYGELDTTVKMVKEALPPKTELVLNADDPLVAQIGYGRDNAFYYGVQSLPITKKVSTETREGRYCTVCGSELKYSCFHYGQLGSYHCEDCDFTRPEPLFLAEEVQQDEAGIRFKVHLLDSFTQYHVPLQGYYNLYNALASSCAAYQLGATQETIKAGLERFTSDAGRMERFSLPEVDLTLTLVKNPTGFNQVIQTLVGLQKEIRLIIAINDLAADGRDISWLWDVEFEILGQIKDQVKQVICSGLRAEDMGLRLKYAGFEESQIDVEKSIDKAIDKLQQHSKSDREAVFVLPTYTLLFPMRDLLLQKRKPTDNRVVSYEN